MNGDIANEDICAIESANAHKPLRPICCDEVGPAMLQRRFVILHFLLFCSVWETHDNQMLGKKQHEKCHYHLTLAVCLKFRKASDTFNFLRPIMRATWSVGPKCSHGCLLS